MSRPGKPAADAQRRFYNAAYAPDRPGAAGARLFRWLHRFEVHRTEVVFRLLPKGGRLLDIGCGNGTFALRCAPFFDDVTGVDVADTQIKAAQERASTGRAGNVTFLTANLDAGIPFADE